MGLITKQIDTGVRETKDRTIEIIKYEEQKKMVGKTTQGLRDLWGNIKKSNVYLLQSKKRKKILGQKKICKIEWLKTPKFGEIQEAQQTPTKQDKFKEKPCLNIS